MAFYSYVMMKSVHVGTEAILHVVREQRDGSVTHVRAARCLLSGARRDQHMVGKMRLSSCRMLPCSKDTLMLVFLMISELSEVLI